MFVFLILGRVHYEVYNGILEQNTLGFHEMTVFLTQN